MTKLQFDVITTGMFLIMKLLLILLSKDLSRDSLIRKCEEFGKLIRDWKDSSDTILRRS